MSSIGIFIVPPTGLTSFVISISVGWSPRASDVEGILLGGALNDSLGSELDDGPREGT